MPLGKFRQSWLKDTMNPTCPDPKVNRKILLDHAIRLQEQYGWSILAIASGSKKPPRHTRWRQYQERRPDQEELERVFADERVGAMAVIHGAVSGGLVIRDFDNPTAYEEWARNHPELASSLPTARTGRGYHVYFRGPSYFQKMPDGEYRGSSKQYSLIPPSPHPSGSIYHWLVLPGDEIPTIGNPEQSGLVVSSNTSSPLSPQSPSLLPLNTPTTSCVGGVLLSTINRHLPKGTGERHRRIFDLVQSIKGIKPDMSLEEQHGVFLRWWHQARQVVATQNVNLSWQDWQDAWRLCQFTSTPDVSTWIALSSHEQLPDKVRTLTQATQRLARVCVWLQKKHKEGFFLSSRLAAEICGCGKDGGLLALRRLERTGHLVLVKKGDYHSGLASSYFWNP